MDTSTQAQSDFDTKLQLISPTDRQVPLYIETGPQFLPMVRWNDAYPWSRQPSLPFHTQNLIPWSFRPEHQLQLMNEEMHRLTSEMNRLWNESANFRDPPLPAFNPRPLSHEFFSTAMAPYMGDRTHAESWRKKENFHLENPVMRDRDGRQQFRLEFDLRQFKPEEIVVSTEGHHLTVQARHEDTNHGKKVHREYFRQCTIPENVDPLMLVSRLGHSGILSVCAPFPVEHESRSIPIVQK